jgi:hypothetical protein
MIGLLLRLFDDFRARLGCTSGSVGHIVGGLLRKWTVGRGQCFMSLSVRAPQHVKRNGTEKRMSYRTKTRTIGKVADTPCLKQ